MLHFQGTHSEKSHESFINALQTNATSDKVTCIQLDLTSFKSAQNFVRQVQAKVPKKNIQLLISKFMINSMSPTWKS